MIRGHSCKPYSSTITKESRLSPTHKLHLYDRSRSTTDWQCPRRRFYTYEYLGKGLQSETTSLELFLGTTLHDGLAAIANLTLRDGTADIDLIASTAAENVRQALKAESRPDRDFPSEQAALTEGLLRGFYRYVWPTLLERYPKIIAVEREILYRHDANGRPAPTDGQFGFMAKPDLILADSSDDPVYVEYKSTSSKKDAWINSWTTAVQVHSTVRAIEQSLGVSPSHVVVQGLYKGYESYGKQSSPFCYAYYRHGNPPFTTAETCYEFKSGYRRVPVWELPGGVAKWVANMPDHVLADQFPQTPPIFMKDEMIEAFFAQRALREVEVMMAHQMLKNDANHDVVMNATFPQRFDQCNPSFGHPCGYRKLCHSPIDDPLSAGFTTRVPHHTPELEAWRVDENPTTPQQ